MVKPSTCRETILKQEGREAAGTWDSGHITQRFPRFSEKENTGDFCPKHAVAIEGNQYCNHLAQGPFKGAALCPTHCSILNPGPQLADLLRNHYPPQPRRMLQQELKLGYSAQQKLVKVTALSSLNIVSRDAAPRDAGDTKV